MKKIVLILGLVLVLASCSYQADQQLLAEVKTLKEKVARLEKTKEVTQEVVKSEEPQTSTGVCLREDFRKAVIGKTQEGVIQAVGKPDNTSEGGATYWVYRNRTKDPITDKVDLSAMLWFRHGFVDSVSFQ